MAGVAIKKLHRRFGAATVCVTYAGKSVRAVFDAGRSLAPGCGALMASDPKHLLDVAATWDRRRGQA